MALLFPLALWLSLWLGVQAGLVENLFESDSPFALFRRLRAVFPLAAGLLALGIIVAKLSRTLAWQPSLISPLGLAAAYGVVGLVGSYYSPDRSVALYWATAYLSVPLVLLGLTWGNDVPDTLRRIIHLNWLILVLVTVILFAVAVIYLHLGRVMLSPSTWFECPLNAGSLGDSWYEVTSHVLRPTGVGRYAALAGIVALGGLWQARWRSMWILVLFASSILLLTSGARGAFLGAAGAVPLVVLIHGGKKALIGAALSLIVLVPLFWTTGIHDQFLDRCIFRTGRGPTLQASAERKVPEPAQTQQIAAGDPAVVPTQDAAGDPAVVPTQNAAGDPAVVPTNVAKGEAPSGAAKIEESPKPEAAAQIEVTPKREAAEQRGIEALMESARSAAFTVTSGRTGVWADGINLMRRSPVVGYGFHADRLLLKTHMHNSYIHALLQAGTLGTLFFIGALVYGWVLVYKILRNRSSLSAVDKHLVVQVAGILAFFLFRSVPESTGAFFGIDWLLLAPLLLYLWAINHHAGRVEGSGSDVAALADHRQVTAFNWRNLLRRQQQ